MATALFEELLFRAILFRIVQEVSGSAAAIVLSAAIFALAHAGNPGASPFAVTALAVGLGLVLALAYLLTGSIWLSVGIHMSWNFTQGFVFGSEVSGLHQARRFLSTSLSGPDLLTGGRFGPEGSILSAGIGLIAAAVLIVLILRKGAWQPRRFRMRLAPLATGI
jgi:hypothetical protein